MEISFKPAPLRSAQTWSVNGKILTTPKGQTIDLAAVSSCHFSDLPVKRYWAASLKLVTESTQVAITCNDTRAGVHRQYFFSFIFEVLDALQTHNPSLTIKRGPGRASNIAFACIAVIPVGFGVKFLVDAFQGGPGMGLAIGFGIFFILMGLFLIWCASPWKAQPIDTPASLRAWLQNWLGGLGTLPKAHAKK